MGRYTLASNRDTHYILEHVNKKKSVNKTRLSPCNHTSAKKETIYSNIDVIHSVPYFLYDFSCCFVSDCSLSKDRLIRNAYFGIIRINGVSILVGCSP